MINTRSGNGRGNGHHYPQPHPNVSAQPIPNFAKSKARKSGLLTTTDHNILNNILENPRIALPPLPTSPFNLSSAVEDLRDRLDPDDEYTTLQIERYPEQIRAAWRRVIPRAGVSNCLGMVASIEYGVAYIVNTQECERLITISDRIRHNDDINPNSQLELDRILSSINFFPSHVFGNIISRGRWRTRYPKSRLEILHGQATNLGLPMSVLALAALCVSLPNQDGVHPLIAEHMRSDTERLMRDIGWKVLELEFLLDRFSSEDKV